MKLIVPTEAGYLAARFGKYATGADVLAAHPKRSFPIEIQDAPADTKTFALAFIDYDAVPVSGFVWLHWLAADIPATVTTIPEDASRTAAVPMVQGRNSNAGGLVRATDVQVAQGYVGPQPPDKDHAYTLMVFALDTTLGLTPGFWLNDLRRAATGHVLAQAELTLWSRA
ncbi:YbhB/YbcL family Raf kinase inhibitor-like protein [Lacticaseibacillus suihuaensis]